MEAKDSEENHDHFDEPNDFISPSSTITLETPISESERQSLYEEITNLRKEKNESTQIKSKDLPIADWY